MYQLTASPSIIKRVSDGACIPIPANESEGFMYEEWLSLGNIPEPAPEPSISELKIYTKRQVDIDAGRITTDTVDGLAQEYSTAEKHALEFQSSGYVDPVPSSVQSWSDAKAIRGVAFTPQQAADDILTTAVAWRTALSIIRQQRLNAKAYIDIANSSAEIYVAYTNWSNFVAIIRAQLGI